MTLALGTRLEQVMREQGVSRVQLAARMGVSRMSLWRWMTGAVPWPADRREQVSVLLRVERAELFEED